MPYIIILYFSLAFLSCNSENVNKRIQPNGIFTVEEIDEISKMLDKFRITICQSKKTTSKCSEVYFQKYWNNFENGIIKTTIDSSELQNILNSISKELESKLFYKTTSIFDNRIPNTSPPLKIRDSIKYVSVNYSKTFSPMLESLSGKYPHLNETKQRTQKIGDISPSILRPIYSNWDKYNYGDDNELLFLSLIILSQTDEQIKKKKSYSKAIRPIEEKLEERSRKRNKSVQ